MISDSWAMGCTRCWDNVASCCWFEISPVLVSVVVSKIHGKIVRTLSEEKLGMKATPMQISSPCCQAQTPVSLPRGAEKDLRVDNLPGTEPETGAGD